jgi:predicted glycosyltransferase involved in capsule biosynthesis
MQFSIVQPYYNHTITWPLHVEQWKNLNPKQAEIVIVDDNSDEGKEPDITLLKDLDVSVRVFRILDDIPWNVTGARNLGAKYARNKHLILADFDYIVSRELIANLQTLDYSDQKVLYWPLQRKYAAKKKRYKFARPHCNSFIINREMFNTMGGYDEDFAGGWGFEDSHFHEVLGSRHGLQNVTLDHEGYFIWKEAAEHHPGTVKYGRLNSGRNHRLYKHKFVQPVHFRSPNILRFQYRLVYDNKL